MLVLIFMMSMYSLLRGANFFWQKENNYPKNNFSNEFKKWSQRIDKVGGDRAYQEFKFDYENKDYLTQHAGAHILGETLYIKLGASGIASCDGSYIFGCYHGFMGRMMGERGPSSLAVADQECHKKQKFAATNCYHGMGHGLLSYMGHSNLIKTLETCSLLSIKKMTGGCYGGAFMEYNLRNLHNLMFSKDAIRTLDPQNPHDPCNTIPVKFRLACYYEQSDWWVNKIGLDFSKTGKLCVDVSNTGEKNICFVGLGRTIASTSHYDIEKISEACKKMPTSDYEVFCRGGAALRYHEYSFNLEKAKSICEDFSQKEKCLETFRDLESSYKNENIYAE